MTEIVQLPFRVIQDTRGVSLEYNCEGQDPYTGAPRNTPFREFLGNPQTPLRPFHAAVFRLIEMYRALESKVAGFDREMEMVRKEYGGKDAEIKSLKAKVVRLEGHK